MGAEGETEPAVVAAIAERFKRNCAGKRIQPTSTVCLRDWQPSQSYFAAFAPEVPAEYLIAIPLDESVIELRVREANDLLAELFLLLRQGEVHQAISVRRW